LEQNAWIDRIKWNNIGGGWNRLMQYQGFEEDGINNIGAKCMD
jgi:hypothetical protein